MPPGRAGDVVPLTEIDRIASEEVEARLRRFLTGDTVAVCDGGPEAARTLLWRAFIGWSEDSDRAYGWMIDSAHLMWCWILSCGTDFQMRDRLTDNIHAGGHSPQDEPLSLVSAYRSNHRVPSVEEAIFALSAIPADLDWDDGPAVACLATAHLRRYENGRAPADLETAIELLRKVARDDPSVAFNADRRLARALDARYDLYAHAADMVEAVSALRRALALPQATPTQRTATARNLASMLLLVHQTTGDEPPLDEAVTLLDELITATDATDSRLPWGNLGTARFLRYELRGDLGDLDAAIVAYRKDAAGNGDDVARANLGGVLVKRFELAGSLADLEEALTSLRALVERTPTDDAEFPLRAISLGAALGHYSAQVGSDEALEEQIALLRRAAEVATDPAEMAMTRHQLGTALTDRFAWHGDPADADEAIECYEQAAAKAADDPRTHPYYLESLGSALNRRFEARGDEHDAARAISTLRTALDLLPSGSADRATLLDALAQFLNDRFRHRHDPADIQEAIRYAEAAVEATPPGHTDRGNHLNDLGIALHHRYDIGNDPADLDRAIATFRASIDASASIGRPLPAPRANLAGALQAKFNREGDLSLLDDAIAEFRMTRRVMPDGDPNRPLHDSNIAEALTLRCRHTAEPQDADEAIALLTAALESLRPGHPRLAVIRSNLASAFAARASLALTDGADGAIDAQTAASHWQTAVNYAPAPAFERMQAALEWTQFADALTDPAQAATAYSAAVRLMPLLAWRGLERGDREQVLSSHRGLTGEAAARNLTASSPEKALELLETGRGVLWTQSVQPRTDLDRLAARTDGLAERLVELRAQIDALP